MATACLRSGKTESAIRTLERASSHKNDIGVIRPEWMRNQLRLADLYSQIGRHADAEKIKDELRKLLTYADPDHWMVKELNRKAASNSNPPS